MITKINEFEIDELERKPGTKTGTIQVRQIDPKGHGFWKRKEVIFSANNADSKRKALDEAIDYAKKATPYE